MAAPRPFGASAALGRRDLRRYFSDPVGYVFITLFILLSAAAAFWRPRFFLDSLANLAQLNEAFPYLLLFFVPALAMGLWADERKQGTDELLLTLPASERSLVLGKCLAAGGVYTIALAVSLSHVLVLAWLGAPDYGLLAATYLGYWLLGAALVPLAMLGSILASNTAIAFVLAALLCAVPVVGGPLSAVPRFEDFARGTISLDGLLYFAGLAGVALYLNGLVLRRRRWGPVSPSGSVAKAIRTPEAWPMSVHAALRAAALAVAIASLVVLAGRLRVRFDLTAAQLSSLSEPTKALLAGMAADRPVIVQAFVSPGTPRPLVQTREQVLGLLREIEARASPTITVTVRETAPYSDAARLARERFNIVPRAVADPSTGETTNDVYLGIAVTAGAEERIIPFVDTGLFPEYEIVRAIRGVSGGGRKRIGIIDTDVRMLGGVDYRDNRPRSAWAAVRDLAAQYDVVEVTPADAAATSVDALIVVLPSRMTQTDLDAAMEPVIRGVPTLMLLDPLPVIDPQLAPAADLADEINPYRRPSATRTVYGDIRAALRRIGLNWVPARIVWDAFNPHPDLASLPEETVFVGDGNGNPDAFNRQHAATAGLRELLLLYPGELLAIDSPESTFESLLQSGRASGTSSFFDVVSPTQTGLAIVPSVGREPDNRPHVLAARLRSRAPIARVPGAKPVHVIAIADLDFISDAIFDVRARAQATANFDNITFFANAVDILAGDESLIALRSRRGGHRTLERLEERTRRFAEQRAREEQQAQQDANAALERARARLTARLEAVDARADLDAQAKQIVRRALEETETRQLRVLETRIADARNTQIRASRERMEAEIRTIRNQIRSLAVLLPPVPVLLIGLMVFIRRRRRERQGARALGRMREGA